MPEWVEEVKFVSVPGALVNQETKSLQYFFHFALIWRLVNFDISVFVSYLFSNLVIEAITHAPKAILIYCDIVGNSLEYHNGYEALDGKSCAKVIEALAKKCNDNKFVVMHSQWRKSIKLAQNEEIVYTKNIIHRKNCIIDANSNQR